MSERLLFIRHGQTTTNREGRIHRRGTIETLDATGREQAKKLVEVCAKNRVQAIYTSPETRAFQTASIVAQGLHKQKPEIIEGLRERSWGEWEGRPWQEVQQMLDGMSLEERYTFIPPGGESWQQMEQRLEKAVEYIIKQGHQSVAIFTHGGTLRGMMPLLEDAPKESSFQYNFNNASVTIFDYKDGIYTEVMVNDISHLQ